MRTQIATALSIAGVMAAGAGAYAVNTTVLSAPKPNPIQVTTTAPQIAQSSLTGGQASAAGTGASSTSDDAEEKETTPQAQSVSPTTTSYQVGQAGSVVIDISSGKIVVTSIAPASGWTSEPARTMYDGSVKVHFVSSTQRLEFVAELDDGKVEVSVRTEDLMSTQPAPAPAPRTEYHDDDDHEEHEREEHESGDDD